MEFVTLDSGTCFILMNY